MVDDEPVVMALGPCLRCRRSFYFNPHAVPAFKGEPVCRGCIAAVNVKRRELGLEPFAVRPDAYEPLPLDEL